MASGTATAATDALRLDVCAGGFSPTLRLVPPGSPRSSSRGVPALGGSLRFVDPLPEVLPVPSSKTPMAVSAEFSAPAGLILSPRPF